MVVMGSCMSTSGEDSDQRKRSNKIDKELEEDSKKLRKECKILLLGMSPASRNLEPRRAAVTC
jgi:guanine nucleotide-binding protein subunit alpha